MALATLGGAVDSRRPGYVGQVCVSRDRADRLHQFLLRCGRRVTRHPLSPTWPPEVLSTVTLTFAEFDGKTTVTLRGIPVTATELENNTFEDGRKFM